MYNIMLVITSGINEMMTFIPFEIFLQLIANNVIILRAIKKTPIAPKIVVIELFSFLLWYNKDSFETEKRRFWMKQLSASVMCADLLNMEKAVADIALEKKKAINDAKDEISGISMAIAEKVVERQLTGEDQSKLINDFINSLGDALWQE